MYTCHVESRDYCNWNYSPPDSNIECPLIHKLFNGDKFTRNGENGTIRVIESVVKRDKNIPGILMLENNRTYGRTENNKRLYYKCRPNDPKIPCFLVAYDISVGFNKKYQNKYVTFSYHHWTDKHPVGVLSQTIGDVYDLAAFNEYQLFCKQLQTSIKPAVSATNSALRLRSVGSYQTEIMECPKRFGNMVNLFDNKLNVFTIDPSGCTDRDDALSILSVSNGDITEHLVTVHIANVWVWIEALGLGDVLGNRVSTIYFPEMKRPMLPTTIGEELCSLDEGNVRFAFSMDFTVIDHPKKGVYIQYLESMRPAMYQSAIQVSKNFVYEEPVLLDNMDYKSLKTLTQKLDKTVKNSHDVVAFWMVQMNRYAAKHMKSERFGIFRTVQNKNNPELDPETEDETIPPIVRAWEQQLTGEYVLYSNKVQNLCHNSLGYSEYVHITSPIRRMVDLLNQIAWVKYHIKDIVFSPGLDTFYNAQINSLPAINEKMKKIRRIQADANILYTVVNDPDLLKNVYKGVILEKGEESVTTVYIEELKWITQCKLPDTQLNVYDKIKCKIFVFDNEEQMRKKIRIQII